MCVCVCVCVRLVESEKRKRDKEGAVIEQALSLSSRTYEVDTDGGDVALGVSVVGEPQQQAGLPHARVSDQQELKQVVAIGTGGTKEKGGGQGE